MARVTIEDCIELIPNRFDLVISAARRSRDIVSGAPVNIERDNDKNPIVALREIAEEKVPVDDISESVIQSLQRFVPTDDQEEEVVELGVEADSSPLQFADDADDDEGKPPEAAMADASVASMIEESPPQ